MAKRILFELVRSGSELWWVQELNWIFSIASINESSGWSSSVSNRICTIRILTGLGGILSNLCDPLKPTFSMSNLIKFVQIQNHSVKRVEFGKCDRIRYYSFRRLPHGIYCIQSLQKLQIIVIKFYLAKGKQNNTKK